MLDGRKGKAHAEGHGAARALRRGARRRAVRGHEQRRRRAGLGESVSAELLQGQGHERVRRDLFVSSISTPTSWSKCRRRWCRPAACRAAPIPTTGRRSAPSPKCSRSTRTARSSRPSHGVKILKTCTPYLAGNTPARGEHCAWMESSAVVYCNSVLGARTNTEGRESTSAAMLTGKIPDWGFHRTEYRFGTHRIDVEVPVESVMDWGMLGYFVGDVVQEHIPVLTGKFGQPDLVRHKHFGAAAASSGGVELYHLVGVTPEAPTLEAAFGSRKAGRDVHVRRGGAAADLRRDQRERQRSERRLRDARLPARGARADRGGLPAARRTTDQRQQRAVDLHVARGARAGRRARLLEDRSRTPAAC